MFNLVTSPLNFRKDNFGSLIRLAVCAITLGGSLCCCVGIFSLPTFTIFTLRQIIQTASDPLISSSFALTSHKDKISWCG